MNERIVTRELVYFTGTKERYLDFSGSESSLPENMRMEYLSNYQKSARKWYDDASLNCKAYAETEIDDFLKNLSSVPMPKVRKEIRFNKMTAELKYKTPEFENLHLYCGATVKNNEIVFPHRDVRPTPCAKIDFQESETVTVTFSVFVSKDYKCKQKTQCGTAQAGRVVEVRSKTLDIAKIKIFNTGEVYSFSKNKWEPEMKLLGMIHFDEWNTFCIEISGSVNITVNGRTFYGIEKTNANVADNLFFDGGMFPRDEWRVKDIKISGKVFACKKNTCKQGTTQTIGEVKLPYATGGYENRDKQLFLKKKFDAGRFKEAFITLSTLDPCGKAWLNGKLILETDTFLKNDICVTDLLKEKDNELVILVEPRPPEVYYYWHRHDDCYNGWFCGEVMVTLTEEHYIKKLDIATKQIDGKVYANADVLFNKNVSGKIDLAVKKCFPQEEKEITVKNIVFSGNRINFDFEGDFEPWDTENPALYTVRAILYDKNDKCIDDFIIETGFRTVRQREGAIYLNGKKIQLNGALIMQFLPPYNEVPINHNCPTDRQIVMQMLMLLNMNANTARLHILGYGTNDRRFARVCDRLGIMLIWTTRLIDSLENLAWEGEWTEKDAYSFQIEEVKNYPSVIMYEGSNEYHSWDLATIDRMYDEFVTMAENTDKTRLLSPCSHLYYSEYFPCKNYRTDGKRDEHGNAAQSSFGWLHPNVVRSAHTYVYLCGYGEPWERMRKQQWDEQTEMIESNKHSYIVSEYAVAALPNPSTKEALQKPYVASYERADEIGAVGRLFQEGEWRESQALQALCAFNATKLMRIKGVDGLLWCCLMSGANNAAYMKPPIDFYGYKKLGYYALRDAFRPIYAASGDCCISYGIKDMIQPIVITEAHRGRYILNITITDENGQTLDKTVYDEINLDGSNMPLERFRPLWEKRGYYEICYELSPKE